MSKHPPLKSAPITEAVIELRYPPNSVAFEKIESFCKSLEERYPKQEVKHLTQVLFSLGKGVGQSTAPKYQDLGVNHIKITSEDNKRIFQVGKDRFSFIKVGKYSSWDDFSAEMLVVWSKFCESTEIKVLSRIGVRFINNLNLPSTMKELDGFLCNAPTIPSKTPSVDLGFLTRIMIANNEIEAEATISRALDPNKLKVAGDKLPVILDIDVYMVGAMVPSGDQLTRCLLKLRNYKNDIFFNSLTSKALELYQ